MYDEEVEILSEFGAGEVANAIDRLGNRVVQVVHDGYEEALLQELEHGVRADEARAASHEDTPLRLLLHLSGGRRRRHRREAMQKSREGWPEGALIGTSRTG